MPSVLLRNGEMLWVVMVYGLSQVRLYFPGFTPVSHVSMSLVRHVKSSRTSKCLTYSTCWQSFMSNCARPYSTPSLPTSQRRLMGTVHSHTPGCQWNQYSHPCNVSLQLWHWFCHPQSDRGMWEPYCTLGNSPSGPSIQRQGTLSMIT